MKLLSFLASLIVHAYVFISKQLHFGEYRTWYTQWINQFKTSWSISLLYRKSMPCAHCLCTTPTVQHQTIAAKPTRIETIVLTQSKIVFNTGQYISHFVSEWGIKRLYTAMCNLCRLNGENDCLISDYSYFFGFSFFHFARR